MRVFRGLLAILLILIILGGIGYIGWTLYFMPMNHTGMNTPPANTTTPHGQTPGNQQMPGAQHITPQNNIPLNTTAIQNRDKLNQAIGTINQAIEQVSIDPYSKATVPSNLYSAQMGAMQAPPTQGTGTINIYPDGNSSVNIAPSGNNPPNNMASSTNTNQGTVNNIQQNQNFVYDQGKLQQLHNGIFTLAQGVAAINQLNDDLLVQSSMVEVNPPNYQTYMVRFNTAMQNRTKLNKSIEMLSQASTLININPYGAPNGYAYNEDAMQQLHQGIYKLAQGMVMLNRLNDDFAKQMADAAAQAQVIFNASGQMNGMSHGPLGWGLFNGISMTSVFNIILIVLLVGLIAGVLGAVFNMFGRRSANKGEHNITDTNGNNPDVI